MNGPTQSLAIHSSIAEGRSYCHIHFMRFSKLDLILSTEFPSPFTPLNSYSIPASCEVRLSTSQYSIKVNFSSDGLYFACSLMSNGLKFLHDSLDSASSLIDRRFSDFRIAKKRSQEDSVL